MWLLKFSDLTNKIVLKLLFPILFLMFIVVSIAVILRIVNISFISSYDISRLFFVWMTFLGMTVIYKRKGHMKFSFLYDRFEGLLKLVMDLVIDVLVFAFFLVITLMCFKLFPRIRIQNLPGSGIPAIWLYMPFFVAPSIMLLHSATFIYERIRTLLVQGSEIK